MYLPQNFTIQLCLNNNSIYGQQYASSISEIKNEIKTHVKSVQIFDDWVRDTIITIGTYGYCYLTCTQQKEPITFCETSNTSIPVYDSKILLNTNI